MTTLEKQALQYCHDVINGTEITTEEVKIQCRMTLDEIEKSKNQEYLYFIDYDFLETVEGILSLLNFATGIDGVIGKSITDRLANFQAYFFYCVLGWKFKSNPKKYRYRDVTLFIARKASKSWMAAIVLIILLLTEDDYSEFYSICFSRDLAAEIKKALTQILNASPAIDKYFKIPKTLTKPIICTLTNSFYQPRVSEPNKNNSIRPTCFIADEIGGFKTKDNINSMRSGQKNVVNAIQISTTTAYAEDLSIMLEELDYIKGVFHKTKDANDRMFALLYYSTQEHLWDDTGMYMANPLRIEDNYNATRENRKLALEKPKDRSEYLTKDMNYFVPSNAGESFINIDDVRKCRSQVPIDWTNREIFGGIDLSMTTDNCSFSMLAYDKETETILADSFCFIPADSIEEKSRTERINYRQFIADGKCFACGDRTIDYGYIENFIMKIEEKYKVKFKMIGFDRYNCLSTAQKLEAEKYEMCEVIQYSKFLHSPTKILEKSILDKKFIYDANELYEINFQNAKCLYDTNLNRYINKKKSTGKIDMVASTIDALWCLEQTELLNNKKSAPPIQVF